jgi:hypothetical protein
MAAARRMQSASPTEVPPNFMTRKDEIIRSHPSDAVARLRAIILQPETRFGALRSLDGRSTASGPSGTGSVRASPWLWSRCKMEV